MSELGKRSLPRRLALLGAASLLALTALAPAGVAAAGSGSIWTTSNTCENPDPQDQNQYMVYETVHVRGTNFDPGTYSWDITQTNGNPKPTVASGTFTVTDTGTWCFSAHLILPAEEGNEYQVTFGDKHDNYQVKGVAATPTPAPTPTPTPTPQGGQAGATLPPTDAASGGSLATNGLGLLLMVLASIVATLMVLTPARLRRRL